MLTVYSMLTILCNRVNKSPLRVLELMKTKGKNTHPTLSPYKQQPQKDKEIKKKIKNLLPQSTFLQHPLRLALFLELLINHSRDQPACIYFHIISLCALHVCA